MRYSEGAEGGTMDVDARSGDSNMVRIVLTAEQVKLLDAAREPVQIVMPDGRVLATVPPTISAEELAEIRRRQQAGPRRRYKTLRVLAHLEALQVEWDRCGGFDAATMRDLLKRFREQDDQNEVNGG